MLILMKFFFYFKGEFTNPYSHSHLYAGNSVQQGQNVELQGFKVCFLFIYFSYCQLTHF